MKGSTSAKEKNVTDPMMEIQGQTLSSQDRFWLDTVKGLTNASITSTEEAAKQIIGLVTLLQGFLFAVVTISDLKTKLALLAGQVNFWILLVLIILPIGCWIASLWLSILVFLPETYFVSLSSPDISRETFFEIVQYKHKRLLQAHVALASGFVPLFVAVVVYLLV